MRKSIKSEEFFKLVAVRAGVSDLDTIKRVFYGMIKVISSELRNKHTVKMPDWGEFNLLIYKSRNTLNVGTGRIEPLPPKPMVKFVPDLKVKKYFYSLMGSSLDEGL